MKKITLILIFSFLLSQSLFAADIVIIVNKKNRLNSISASELKLIFLGKKTGYKPVDLRSSKPAAKAFASKYLDKSPRQLKEYWLGESLRGRAKKPKTYGSVSRVKEYVSDNVKGIGYIPKSDVDSSVKVIRVTR